MSKRDKLIKPLSLAQHFDAPQDFRGGFGWICGYSADAAFLDDAAERFTRQTRAQRAYGGHIALALMLDPGNSNISAIDAPGVMHLPIKNIHKKPFLLLHAKVAILGFRHETDVHRWQLRLIVSTGNWTRQTLEESLDLAWRIDLSSDEFPGPREHDHGVQQVCTDIKAAWEFMNWLKDYFDTRILDALPPEREDSETGRARQLFESWIGTAAGNAGAANPQFLDNRKESFLDQLPTLVKATGATGKRNYLAMGSGFYESSSRKDVIPPVLHDIVRRLQGHRMLTATPEIDIFVKAEACQAVAASQQALSKAGFTVRPAGQPDFFGQKFQRSLHAKFIFSANCRNNSNSCNSAWLYIGSGNLTGPGFCNKASANGGNLEAGVVFAPEDLYWKQVKGLEPWKVVTNVLPVQWETDVSSLHDSMSEGSDMPDRDNEFIAAPIAWLLWCEDAGSSWLKALGEEAAAPFEILNEVGEVCAPDGEGRFPWHGNRPRQVRLRWVDHGKTQESFVPVLDKFGRLAATVLPQIDLDQAWWQLASFPMPPDDEDVHPGDDLEGHFSASKSDQTSVASKPFAVYPIRQMMQLIENIAAKQTALSQIDWPAWCSRLEQCLNQASSGSALNRFVELGINPLSPLWETPFRPTFAETNDTPDGQRYEALLRRVEAEWNVVLLKKIGGDNE
jgi:hypothetical protein